MNTFKRINENGAQRKDRFVKACSLAHCIIRNAKFSEHPTRQAYAAARNHYDMRAINVCCRGKQRCPRERSGLATCSAESV